MLVPPLIINFVEYSLGCKERLRKRQAAQNVQQRSKTDKTLAFSDDGFEMGLAYLLQLLDQNTLFDSLHWFKAMHTKLDIERVSRRVHDLPICVL